MAKAEEQEKLLQESNNELEERRRRAERLRRELEEKEVRTYGSYVSSICRTDPMTQYLLSGSTKGVDIIKTSIVLC